MQKKMELKAMGFRRPTSPESLKGILEYIDKNDFDPEILIDLRGCIFSYPLAKILEKLVVKIKDVPGHKSIKIIHGYSLAFPDHLLPYLTKKVSYLDGAVIGTTGDLTDFIHKNFSIDFSIEKAS